MPGKQTLNKKQRLKSTKSIEELFSAGKSVVSGQCKSFYLESGTGLRFAAGVSTKNFRKAVDRNRVKRLLRESWRLQKNILEEKFETTGKGLNVFILYTGKELPLYADIFQSMGDLIKKLVKATG